jgi:hypothetical protein
MYLAHERLQKVVRVQDVWCRRDATVYQSNREYACLWIKYLVGSRIDSSHFAASNLPAALRDIVTVTFLQ